MERRWWINKGGEASNKNAALGNARIRGISVEELSRAFPGDSFPLPRFPFIRLESIEKSIVSSETTTALIRLSITALGVPTLFTLTRRKQMNLRLEKKTGEIALTKYHRVATRLFFYHPMFYMKTRPQIDIAICK